MASLEEHIVKTTDGRAARALLAVLSLADRMAHADYRGNEPQERVLGRHIRRLIATELNFTDD